MTPEQVERQVIEDCELVDRTAAAREPVKTHKGPRRPRTNVIAEAEHATGVNVIDTEKLAPTLWKPSFMFRNPAATSRRWGFACGRVERIKAEGKDGRAYVGACGPLAYAYDTLWACFQSRNLPAKARGFAVNDFDGLTDKDAARAFMRGVEDICDQSTGVLGSWYTK